ncbi:hypothetical protein GCM10027299_01890 [Larkinella ripae]
MRSRFLLVAFLVIFQAKAQLFKPYEEPRRWAATAELGGLSPVFALNLEYTPLRFRSHFFTIRAGVGSMFTHYSLLTLPHSLTVNLLLNPKSSRCPPPVGFRKLWFLELGWGGLAFVRPLQKGDFRSSPLVGVRQYFKLNQERTTGFLKAQLTPLILDRWRFWGGFGFGVIL